MVCGLLIVVASLVAGARALGAQASVVVARGLSCSAAQIFFIALLLPEYCLAIACLPPSSNVNALWTGTLVHCCVPIT